MNFFKGKKSETKAKLKIFTFIIAMIRIGMKFYAKAKIHDLLPILRSFNFI